VRRQKQAQRAKMSAKIKQNIGRALKIGSGALLVALLTAVFVLVVIMSEPRDAESVLVTDQPLLPAAPAVNIASADELEALLASFPEPVLCVLPGAGLTLTGGSCYDTAFEDGFARVAELRYALEDGGEMVLTSIYPARASTLMERDGYALIGATELAGMEAVRMSRAGSIRLHAQHSEAFYVLTVPEMSFGELSALAGSIQRMHMTGE